MDPILADNLRCIDQAIDLLGHLDVRLYTLASQQTLGAGIGGHIRHNIDHYESFLNRPAANQINYEHRHREPELETDPALAGARLRAIRKALQMMDTRLLDSPIQVKMETAESDSPTQWAASTERRELQFLLSHSVHHYAIIAIICRLHGAPIPEEFGVAPSTLRFRKLSQSAQCAQ